MGRLIRILSIDGGGIRGIIPAQILTVLERKLQDRMQDETRRIADYFDMIAGTSTGGILACLYLFPDAETSRPRYSADEAVDVYLQHGQEIFELPLSRRIRSAAGLIDEKYSAHGLAKLLANYFKSAYLSDLLKPCLITAYDIRRRRAMFFTQHDARERASKDFPLTDVTRATSAAPTYFETVRIRSRTDVSYPVVDGGVFANNPALCAYAEARNHFGAKAADMAILSLGTGEVRKPYPYAEAKDWGAVGWMKPLVDIMMSGVSETVDYECRTAFEAVGVPDQYLRVNVEMSRLPRGATCDMDDVSKDNLLGLRELGEEAAERKNRELDAFVDLLTNERSQLQGEER